MSSQRRWSLVLMVSLVGCGGTSSVDVAAMVESEVTVEKHKNPKTVCANVSGNKYECSYQWGDYGPDQSATVEAIYDGESLLLQSCTVLEEDVACGYSDAF